MSTRTALTASALSVLVAVPTTLLAVTISLPNTFANGTVADADEVNANFVAITDALEDVDGYTGTLVLQSNAGTGAFGPDLTSAAHPHFVTWAQSNPPGAGSPNGDAISDDSDAQFGWHATTGVPSFPDQAGTRLDAAYVVRSVAFQSHVNPLRLFDLQGSNESTNGTDGTWTTVFSGEMTERGERVWQAFTFDNDTAYQWWRVNVRSMWSSGWALYEWELNEENAGNTTLVIENGLIKEVTP
jgi:hypothetical protein